MTTTNANPSGGGVIPNSTYIDAVDIAFHAASSDATDEATVVLKVTWQFGADCAGFSDLRPEDEVRLYDPRDGSLVAGFPLHALLLEQNVPASLSPPEDREPPTRDQESEEEPVVSASPPPLAEEGDDASKPQGGVAVRPLAPAATTVILPPLPASAFCKGVIVTLFDTQLRRRIVSRVIGELRSCEGCVGRHALETNVILQVKAPSGSHGERRANVTVVTRVELCPFSTGVLVCRETALTADAWSLCDAVAGPLAVIPLCRLTKSTECVDHASQSADTGHTSDSQPLEGGDDGANLRLPSMRQTKSTLTTYRCAVSIPRGTGESVNIQARLVGIAHRKGAGLGGTALTGLVPRCLARSVSVAVNFDNDREYTFASTLSHSNRVSTPSVQTVKGTVVCSPTQCFPGDLVTVSWSIDESTLPAGGVAGNLSGFDRIMFSEFSRSDLLLKRMSAAESHHGCIGLRDDASSADFLAAAKRCSAALASDVTASAADVANPSVEGGVLPRDVRSRCWNGLLQGSMTLRAPRTPGRFDVVYVAVGPLQPLLRTESPLKVVPPYVSLSVHRRAVADAEASSETVVTSRRFGLFLDYAVTRATAVAGRDTFVMRRRQDARRTVLWQATLPPEASPPVASSSEGDMLHGSMRIDGAEFLPLRGVVEVSCVSDRLTGSLVGAGEEHTIGEVVVIDLDSDEATLAVGGVASVSTSPAVTALAAQTAPVEIIAPVDVPLGVAFSVRLATSAINRHVSSSAAAAPESVRNGGTPSSSPQAAVDVAAAPWLFLHRLEACIIVSGQSATVRAVDSLSPCAAVRAPWAVAEPVTFAHWIPISHLFVDGGLLPSHRYLRCRVPALDQPGLYLVSLWIRHPFAAGTCGPANLSPATANGRFHRVELCRAVVHASAALPEGRFVDVPDGNLPFTGTPARCEQLLSFVCSKRKAPSAPSDPAEPPPAVPSGGAKKSSSTTLLAAPQRASGSGPSAASAYQSTRMCHPPATSAFTLNVLPALAGGLVVASLCTTSDAIVATLHIAAGYEVDGADQVLLVDDAWENVIDTCRVQDSFSQRTRGKYGFCTVSLKPPGVAGMYFCLLQSMSLGGDIILVSPAITVRDVTSALPDFLPVRNDMLVCGLKDSAPPAKSSSLLHTPSRPPSSTPQRGATEGAHSSAAMRAYRVNSAGMVRSSGLRPATPKSRALLIGCCYTGKAHELSGPGNDVSAMYESLCAVYGRSRLPPDRVVVMTDAPNHAWYRRDELDDADRDVALASLGTSNLSQREKRDLRDSLAGGGLPNHLLPTAHNIRLQLRRLVDSVVEDEDCLIYFSGHGTTTVMDGDDGGNGAGIHPCLLPIDFDWGRRMLPLADVLSAVRELTFRSKRGRITVVVDAAFSGTAVDCYRQMSGATGSPRWLSAATDRRKRHGLSDSCRTKHVLPPWHLGGHRVAERDDVAELVNLDDYVFARCRERPTASAEENGGRLRNGSGAWTSDSILATPVFFFAGQGLAWEGAHRNCTLSVFTEAITAALQLSSGYNAVTNQAIFPFATSIDLLFEAIMARLWPSPFQSQTPVLVSFRRPMNRGGGGDRAPEARENMEAALLRQTAAPAELALGDASSARPPRPSIPDSITITATPKSLPPVRQPPVTHSAAVTAPFF